MITPTRAKTFASSARPTAAALPLAPLPVRNPDSLSVAEIRALIEAHHPSVLNGDPDINTITLVVDARGNYVVSTAESRPIAMPVMIAEGRGGRGRSGGAAPAMAGGGDIVYARARGGGGGQVAQMDSATVEARTMELRVAAAKLIAAQSMLDTSSVRAEQRAAMKAKVALVTGDTVVVDDRGRQVLLTDGIMRNGNPAKPVTAEQLTTVGRMIGLNTDVLSRLIDPASIESVQTRLFAAGQMGPSVLKVFVVHQRP
jgi:hypothetical protein